MELNEAISVLHTNGYKMIDEGFFTDAYTKYKKKVFKKLKKFNIDLEKYEKTIEDWIRDYFVEGMNPTYCALAIRDNCK